MGPSRLQFRRVASSVIVSYEKYIVIEICGFIRKDTHGGIICQVVLLAYMTPP